MNEEPVEQQHSEGMVLDTSASTNNSNTHDSQSVSTSQPITAESTGTVSNEQNSINSNNNVSYCQPKTDQNYQSLYYLQGVAKKKEPPSKMAYLVYNDYK